MALWHLRSKRTPTGANLKRNSKKKRSMRGSNFLEGTVGPRSVIMRRGRGGNVKTVLFSEETANVVDPKTRKYSKVKILAVVKNPANPHYARRNVLTRGAVIKTEIGEAVVTSRPAQHGVINAKLIKK
jgi:small subunit ribosomal protein S8e